MRKHTDADVDAWLANMERVERVRAAIEKAFGAKVRMTVLEEGETWLSARFRALRAENIEECSRHDSTKHLEVLRAPTRKKPARKENPRDRNRSFRF